MNDILRDALLQVGARQAARCPYEVSFGRPVAVSGDAAALRDALAALVGHVLARAAARNDDVARVRVASSTEGLHARIDICDRAEARPLDTLRALFEAAPGPRPAEEAEASALAHAHATLRAAGGSVTATSAPGEGTTLTVRLPKAGAASGFAAANDPPSPSIERPLNVLAVDDDALALRWLARAIGSQHRVALATSVADALALVRSGRVAFDVVVADLAMPGAGGLDLYTAVRAWSPALAERFVFLAEGRTDTPEERVGRRLAHPVVDKPSATGRLLGAIRRASRAGEWRATTRDYRAA